MPKFDATLRKVFYNASTGFSSIAKTYKAAKALDDNVTLAATRDFLKASGAASESEASNRQQLCRAWA